MSDATKPDYIPSSEELSARQDETLRQLDELLESFKDLESLTRDESDTYEHRFVDRLDLQKFTAAGVRFDELYRHYQKYRKGEELAFDALFVKDDRVAILRVKQRLQLKDVVEVRDSLIGRFRRLCPEHQNRRLMVIVAGEHVDDNTAATALEAGLVVWNCKADRSQMQDQQLRYY